MKLSIAITFLGAASTFQSIAFIRQAYMVKKLTKAILVHSEAILSITNTLWEVAKMMERA